MPINEFHQLINKVHFPIRDELAHTRYYIFK